VRGAGAIARDTGHHGDLHAGVYGLAVFATAAERPLGHGLEGGGLEFSLLRADRRGVADIARWSTIEATMTSPLIHWQ